MEKIIDAMREAKTGRRWEPQETTTFVANCDKLLELCKGGCGVYVRKNGGLCSMCTKKEDVVDDIVNHPPHYTASKYEVFDVLREWERAGMIGCVTYNVIKYLARYRLKGKALNDLKKAKWYLEREIEEYEQKDKV